MKKKPAKVEHATSFYVGVQNPEDVRKTALETIKELLVCLRQYEHIKGIRNQKQALYNKYHQQITTIRNLINKLQRAVPKHNLQMLEASKPEPVVVKEEQKVEEKIEEVVAKPAVMDEVTRLESELAEIERKLSSM